MYARLVLLREPDRRHRACAGARRSRDRGGLRELVDEPYRRFVPVLRAEYELTKQQVLKLRGCARLLDAEPTIQRSIMLRNPYIDPMHLMQVDLLRRWRGGRERSRAVRGAARVGERHQPGAAGRLINRPEARASQPTSAVQRGRCRHRHVVSKLVVDKATATSRSFRGRFLLDHEIARACPATVGTRTRPRRSRDSGAIPAIGTTLRERAPVHRVVPYAPPPSARGT